jgi:hypothetical protein
MSFWDRHSSHRRLRGALALLLCVVGTSSCGDGSSGTPVAPAPIGSTPLPFTVEVFKVEAGRWSGTGGYIYDVLYRVHNASREAATYRIAGFTLIGPQGETLGGRLRRTSEAQTAAASTYSPWTDLGIDDDDASHPFAEYLRLTVVYQLPGGVSGEHTAQDVVLHGPQTARIHDFSLSPLEVKIGDPVTVRWNIQSARQVVLETSIPTAPGEVGWGEEVELVGSRTFIARRDGVALATLTLDRGAFTRTVRVLIRR